MPIHCVNEPSVLRGYLLRYRLYDTDIVLDPVEFLGNTKQQITEVLANALRTLLGLKFQTRISIKFFKPTDETVLTGHFTSDQTIALPGTNLDQAVTECTHKMLERIEHFQGLGSGWSIERVLDETIHIAKYQPINGSSYLPLPRKLALKHAIINVKNDDQMCFVWSILACLRPAQRNAQRVNNYRPFLGELDINMLLFPVTLDQIDLFCEHNGLSISVYGYDRHVYPLRLPGEIRPKHINLFLIQTEGKSHYCWIKDLDALLFDRNSHKNRKYYCQVCLRAFYLPGEREEHEQLCRANAQKVVMPQYSTIVKFDQYHKMIRKPVVIYADFECLLEPLQSCSPSPSASFSLKKQLHTPSGFAMVDIMNCCSKSPPNVGKLQTYRGKKALENFFTQILLLNDHYRANLRQQFVTLRMQPGDWDAHNAADHCHLCSAALHDDKVADHCHVCGSYIGAAHAACNIACQVAGDICVFFHNLRKYDGHLLMQHIGEVAHRYDYQLDCIPKGLEDYVTFSLVKRVRGKIVSRIKFMDSCQFLPASLDSLVQNLAQGGVDKFPTLTTFFKQNVDLILRKGIFPYEYMTDESKFDDASLPPIAEFYSSLKGESVTTEEYEHAQNVWRAFNIRNLGEYQDLYVQTDVLLLADVFQNFRNFCFDNYKLDPCQFFTLPSFGWSACLLMTKVELELLRDKEMYQFFELGLRGGVSVICHRHAVANNPVLGNFDESLPETYILYLDANNLYGWAMIQYLPVSGFRWLSEQEIAQLDIDQVADDSDVGYVLEVDLLYPQHLHGDHNDYPLAPERLKVPFGMMSPYCQKLHEQLRIQGSECEKLVPNLYDKQHYIVHYRNLKLYRQLGVQLTKVHRCIRFTQKPWIKPYIDFNTQKRTNATNDFEKDLYKLLNN